jgi:excisionase family DNA binding protein
MTPTELFTTTEVAEVTGRSVRTVQRWTSSGSLSPFAFMGAQPLYADADVFAVEHAARNTVGGRPRAK